MEHISDAIESIQEYICQCNAKIVDVPQQTEFETVVRKEWTRSSTTKRVRACFLKWGQEVKEKPFLNQSYYSKQDTFLSQYVSLSGCINTLCFGVKHFRHAHSTQSVIMIVLCSRTRWFTLCFSPPRCMNLFWSCLTDLTRTMCLTTSVYKFVVLSLRKHFAFIL